MVHIQMHSSNSLLYKLYSLSSLYSVKHQVQCHLCVDALQTLIGTDQDNDVDKWLHETDESFGGRGWVQQLCNVVTKQVMFHTSEQHKAFCLSVLLFPVRDKKASLKRVELLIF